MRHAASIWRATACVQVMRPGTCPLHRIRSDGRPRGGSKELRQHGRRRFCQVDWHEMFHSFRHRGPRCVARARHLLPAALLVVACYPGSASFLVWPLLRGGDPRGSSVWCFLHVYVPPHAAARLPAGCGPRLTWLMLPVPCKHPLLYPSRPCGSRPFSPPVSALRPHFLRPARLGSRALSMLAPVMRVP